MYSSITFITVLYISVAVIADISDKELELRRHFAATFLDQNEKLLRNEGADTHLSDIFKPNTSTLSDPSSPNLILSDVGTAPCLSGWTRYEGNGNCYIQADWWYNWYDAEAWCWDQREGAHLASVHSQEEAVWIHATFVEPNRDFDEWIGLKRSCDNVTYYWTDGSPVDYVWWQPRYPKARFAEESCTTIWEADYLHLKTGYVPGQFDDMKYCFAEQSKAICMYDPNTSTISPQYVPQVCSTPGTTGATTKAMTTTPEVTTTNPTTTTVTTTIPTTTVPTTTKPFSPTSCRTLCAADWVYYNDMCYAKLQGTGSYLTSSAKCSEFGGVIANVADESLNEAMRKAFSTNSEDLEQAWITCTSSYTNWAPGFGSNSGYMRAMTLSSNDEGTYVQRGLWRDYHMSTQLNYVICERYT